MTSTTSLPVVPPDSPSSTGRASQKDEKEIAALIQTLRETETRLDELTARSARTTEAEERPLFRGHDRLRDNDASTQVAILDALPARVALLDARGLITAANQSWQKFLSGKMMHDPGHAIGLNYLEICDQAAGAGATQSHHIADQIRSVLSGAIKNFSIEYLCPAQPVQRWFHLTVTPLGAGRPNGVMVMHVDITAERLVEDNLRASELRFRQMAENIDEVFFLIDPDNSEMHYVSPAYEQIWQRTCESLYANPTSWADSIHPDDRAYSYAQFKEGRLTGFDYEYRIIRPGGEVRWISARGFPILDAAGNPYRTAGIASDITERKEASDALHESDRRFSALLDNVQMVSMMLDTEGRFTYCNDYLLHLTGWTREEIIGRSAFDVLIAPAEDRDVRDTFSDLLANAPSASHHENEILTRSGAKRLIQWNNMVLRSSAGEVTGTASIGADITERKQSEAKLSLQSTALNAADNAMLITDRDLKIVWTNPAFTELTGYTETEAAGHRPHDLLRSGVHGDSFYRAIETTIFRGESWRGESMNRRKDGRLYPEASIITPVKDKAGKITHFISIKTDLTAHRHLESQLRQAQKMEAVGQLAAGVAHEFNNLLQALMTRASIVRMRAATPELERIGAEMELQIKRGGSITQQLLVFSRTDPPEKCNLDLGAKIRKVSLLLRQLIPETITVVVETSPVPIFIEGDAGQLQQVLLNLAINARDAMPAGGTLTLRAGSHSGEVFLEVEDTGVGMDDTTRSRIFEPFFTTKEVGKGTGLGLSVVYGIVKQHGGRIDVNSDPGKGSCFRVVLPSGSNEVLAVIESSAVELPVGVGRVLLVEDEEGVRDGIAALLEVIGYEVIAVASGEEAISIPQEPAPDLLLSDVTLPGIPGAVLGECLLERWPSLKVVLMSGYLDASSGTNASERGWHFLQKPFEMADLARQLALALKEQRSGGFGNAVSDLATSGEDIV